MSEFGPAPGGGLPAFLSTEIPALPPEACRFHVVPAPWEASVSYGGGTAGGPAAILRASGQLEAFDGKGEPCLQGIHTHPAVDCRGAPETVLTRLSEAVERVLDCGAIPALLGGEHTVTLGALRAFTRAGKEAFGVLHLDAHADLRDRYEGTPLSHACVMRRALDLGLPVFQAGVRALCREEHELRESLQLPRIDAAELDRLGPDAAELPGGFPDAVYVSFDVDFFDPSLMPATGTPVPGGPGWNQAVRLLQHLLEGRRIVGFDVVELAPLPGWHGPEFTAAQLVYTLMGMA